MKCPKCGYLGYERRERCRNCGYEFALVSAPPEPDLRLRNTPNMPAPIEDLQLVDAAANANARTADRFADAVPEARTGRGEEPLISELPLFGPPIADDVPLITKPSPPRPPLSVRRATPEVPRLRSEPRAPLLDWPADPPSSPPPVPRPMRPPEPTVDARKASTPPTGGAPPASLIARAVAAAIDFALLAIVDVVVVYFTLKICRLSPDDWRLLPKAPLLVFLLVQNGGYLVAFTAVGQTLGKMIAGVRVMADDHDGAPDFGRAVLRQMLWLPLALPAGAGLLSAALHEDRRGWHDRFAGTRVVSARA